YGTPYPAAGRSLPRTTVRPPTTDRAPTPCPHPPLGRERHPATTAGRAAQAAVTGRPHRRAVRPPARTQRFRCR
ncbi:hypothetical protein ACFPN6_11320, partial [Streptomyces fimbriatus]